MPITFTESYGYISNDAISGFEGHCGMTLPQIYKDFLLQWNGGRPNWTVFEVPGWPGKATSLHFFFGIHAGKHNNLASWFEELRDRLPEGFLAIGIDMGGNHLCMGTAGEFSGQIWYWDSSWDYDLKDGTMFKVGEDINDFLGKLRASY